MPTLKTLSVVIPCYNEEGNIERYEQELFPSLATLAENIEYVFVDDGSTDGTYERLRKLQEKYPAIKISKHLTNQGLGSAVRTAFKEVSGEAVLTLDSDLTFHPTEAIRLLAAYDDTVVCVMGSPFLGRLKGVSALRKFLSAIVNSIYHVLLGKPFTATSSIFRLYRASALKDLPLKATSFDINAEILFYLLRRNQGGVREVAATLTTRTHGESKLNTLREIKNHLLMFARMIIWRLNPFGKS